MRSVLILRGGNTGPLSSWNSFKLSAQAAGCQQLVYVDSIAGDLRSTATKRTCAPTSLWMTRQPSQRANTEPLAHACGLTALVLVSPHMLQVNRTCSEQTSAL